MGVGHPVDRVFSRDFILVSSVSFFCTINFYLLLIIITDYAVESFGASSAEAGLSAGLYVIGGLVSRLFLGRYIELFGRKRTLVLSIAAALAISISYFFVSSMIVLHAVRFVHGLAYGMMCSSYNDIAAKLVPASKRAEGLGYFYLSITLANAIGPYLGLTLSGTSGYHAVFMAGTAVYVLSLIASVMIRVQEEVLTERQIEEIRGFGLNNLIQSSAVPLSLTVMVFYLGYSGVLAFMSAYTSVLGMHEIAGMFYVILACGTLVSRLTMGRIMDVRGPTVVAVPAFMLYIAGMVMFANMTQTWMLFLSGLLMGFGMSTIWTVCQTLVISCVPPHRYGVATSTFCEIADMGSGIGPMMLGALIPVIGYGDMYMVCALFGVASMLMYLGLHDLTPGGE